MNKELKTKFENEYKNVWGKSQSMQNYCIKKLSNGVQLENGILIEFEKPSIKKDFCFGAGQNGVTTTEEWNNANEMVSYARNSEEYFINENMAKYEELENILNAETVYLNRYNKHNYIDCDAISDELPYQDWLRVNFIELTQKDVENLKNVIEEEKTKFMKRLNTYLKKYGLSKVNSWSYISD